MFTSVEVFPGVRHITDAMGVSFTLLAGKDRAILLDTGYGLENVSACVRSFTDRPLDVILSHGHHDHVLGARWFAESAICGEDLPIFRLRTARAQRESVRNQALGKGLTPPADFLTAPIPEPKLLSFTGVLGDFPCLDTDLGGLDVRILRVPGHTPGSLVILVPAFGLLLTGDDWNPTTWMWFAESLDAEVWRENMLRLIRLAEETMPLQHVLCSHQPMLREGSEVKEFLDYMTNDRLRSAPPVDMNSPIQTRAIQEPARGWTLVFDGARFHG